MKLARYIFLLLPVLAVNSTNATDVITADSVVSIALKNNFDILVSKNDATIGQTNNTLGNAGMLPSVLGTIADNYSVNNIHQKQSSGSEITRSGASSNVTTASVALSWTVFDGGKMFVTRKKLAEIQSLGEIQFQDKVQQTVYNVLSAYYNVVKQKQQLESVLKVMSYNEERVKILQASFSSGLSSKNTYLQAQIDLNVNRENVIIQRNIILTAKRALNQLLAQNTDSLTFEVADSINVSYTPDKADLQKRVETTNTSLLALQKQIDIARLTIKETQRSLYPKVSLNAGYFFSQTDNSAGVTLYNRAVGPQIGGSVSVPLYQAGNTKRQIKVATLQANSAEYTLQNMRTQIGIQLNNALTDFDNEKQLLEIEKENKNLAAENLQIAIQRLRFGQTTPLEVRQAQQSFEDALTRYINFSYNLKNAETRLKQLVGQL